MPLNAKNEVKYREFVETDGVLAGNSFNSAINCNIETIMHTVTPTMKLVNSAGSFVAIIDVPAT